MKSRMAVVVCIFASMALLTQSGQAAPHSTLPGDSVYQLPVKLADSGGREITWSDLRGKPRVVTMFYTSCRYVCPLVVDSLRAVERGLTAKQRAQVGFVLISMDPVRDTPEVLAGVMRERHLDPAGWLLLEPRPEDVRGIAGVLGIRYRALSDGEFNHTTSLILLDSSGRVTARTDRVGAEGGAEFLVAVQAAADAR